jgi:hypothetical protein
MVAILYINGMVETKQYGVHGYTFTPENIGKKFRDKPNNKVFITEYGYVEQHILNMLKLETLIPYSYIEDFCTAVDSGINALDAVLVSTVSRLIELGVNRVRVINKHLEISIDGEKRHPIFIISVTVDVNDRLDAMLEKMMVSINDQTPYICDDIVFIYSENRLLWSNPEHNFISPTVEPITQTPLFSW